MREHVLLQLFYILFVLFGRKLAGVVFEDGLYGLFRVFVKENDRCDVFSKRFCDASDLLDQDPHTEAAMASTKPEVDQLARAIFHVFQSSAVIENDERVRALKKETGYFDKDFNLVMIAANNENVRVIINETVIGRVFDKGRAN